MSDTQNAESSLEQKKARAIDLYKSKRELEQKLIYEAHWNSFFWMSKSSDEVLGTLKEPKRASMLVKIGRALRNALTETLYPSASEGLIRTALPRALGFIPLMLIAIPILFVAAGVALTSNGALLASVGAVALALGSAAYLGMAIWDYYKTPKELRTPLQKFNMLSSLPSTLFVFGLTAAVICASLAIPGAIFAVPAIAGVWLAYKAWQGNKGAALKQAETEKKVEELKQIESSLKHLEQEPEVEKAVTAYALENDLKALRASETYIQMTGYETRLVEALGALKAGAASTENKQTDEERALELDKAAPSEEAVAEASLAQIGFFAERRPSQDETESLLREEEKSFTI